MNSLTVASISFGGGSRRASPVSNAVCTTAVATLRLTWRASAISGRRLFVQSFEVIAGEQLLRAFAAAKIIGSVQCFARLTMQPNPIPGNT